MRAQSRSTAECEEAREGECERKEEAGTQSTYFASALLFSAKASVDLATKIGITASPSAVAAPRRFAAPPPRRLRELALASAADAARLHAL